MGSGMRECKTVCLKAIVNWLTLCYSGMVVLMTIANVWGHWHTDRIHYNSTVASEVVLNIASGHLLWRSKIQGGIDEKATQCWFKCAMSSHNIMGSKQQLWRASLGDYDVQFVQLAHSFLVMSRKTPSLHTFFDSACSSGAGHHVDHQHHWIATLCPRYGKFWFLPVNGMTIASNVSSTGLLLDIHFPFSWWMPAPVIFQIHLRPLTRLPRK